MIIKKQEDFHVAVTGEEHAVKILSDDEFVNAAHLERRTEYLRLTQSRGGKCLHEIELAPSEVKNLLYFLAERRAWKLSKLNDDAREEECIPALEAAMLLIGGADRELANSISFVMSTKANTRIAREFGERLGEIIKEKL
jgi:hypothetical protein